MQLYFLRHADAATLAETDDERPISAKGVEQAKKVARFCEARGVTGIRILTSPLLRARQTAEIVAKHLGAKMQEVPWLACGMRPQEALDRLREIPRKEAVMLVGHEPDFSGLVSHLLAVPDAEHIEIRKASLTLLNVDALEPGGARLDFLVPCRLM